MANYNWQNMFIDSRDIVTGGILLFNVFEVLALHVYVCIGSTTHYLVQ